MYIYVAKVKQGENFSIRVFQTKAGATKAVKTAQAELYMKMEYNKNHDMHVGGVYVHADPDVKHKKEKVTREDGMEVYYVDVYGKDGDFYYHKLAGYIKKTVVEY